MKKRILILIKPTQKYVWVNYPSLALPEAIHKALTDMYGDTWQQVEINQSITLTF